LAACRRSWKISAQKPRWGAYERGQVNGATEWVEDAPFFLSAFGRFEKRDNGY
jgi:hypothetical protein